MHSIVSARLKRWEDSNDRVGLFRDSVSDCPPPSSGTSQKDRNLARCRKLVELHRIHDAVMCLASEGTVTPTAAIVAELRSKHVQDALPVLPTEPAPAALAVDSALVGKCLSSFKKGTGCGTSGLRAEHLKDALRTPIESVNESSLSAITTMVNLFLSGKCPTSLAPFIAGAPLLALKKRSGGIRPIAVGEIWRRLTSKSAVSAVRHKAATLLAPLQVGVGISGGAEAVIHATQALTQALGQDSSRVMFTVDAQNAFNQISRTIMVREVRKHFPELAAWVEYSYGQAGNLYFGEHRILSGGGTQQGDPLSPLLFALAIQPMIAKIKSTVEGLDMNAWFLDDGTFIGTIEQIGQVISLLEEHGPSIGFHLNHSKCELWWPSMDHDRLRILPASFKRVTAGGLEVLGCPIGHPDYVQGIVNDRIDKIAFILERMHDLNDSQLEIYLLRASVGLPRLIYALRTCDPLTIWPNIVRFDSKIQEALVFALTSGHDLPEAARIQAGLPVSSGGFGFPSAASRASVCFLSSVRDTLPLQERLVDSQVLPRAEFSPCLNHFKQGFPRLSPTFDQDWSAASNRQEFLSTIVDDSLNSALVQQASRRDKAKFLSLSLPYSGAWHSVPPVKKLLFSIQSQAYVFLTKYHLGIPILQRPLPCPGCHTHQIDIYGDHIAQCTASPGVAARHNAIRDVLASLFRQAGFSVRAEIRLFADTNERPADLFIDKWLQGRPLAIDVSVVSPLCPSYLDGSSGTAGYAASKMVESKIRKYADRLKSQESLFAPFVMETFGGFHPSCADIVDRLAKALSERVDDLSVSAARVRIYQRISLASQQSLANSFLARLSNCGG